MSCPVVNAADSFAIERRIIVPNVALSCLSKRSSANSTGKGLEGRSCTSRGIVSIIQEWEAMMPNNAFERTGEEGGPRLAAARAPVAGRVNHRTRLSEALMKGYRPAKKRATVTVGESVRILRELQGMRQNQLAEASGIPQATISAIENDSVRLGVERAKVLARALKCHPGVLVFPGWTDEEAA